MDQLHSKPTSLNPPEAMEQTAVETLPGDRLYPQGMPPPGASAGLEPCELSQRPTVTGSVRVTCIDYGPEEVHVQEVANLPDFLKQHRPEWCVVRWISVHGLKDMEAIRALVEKYQLHPLAIEHILSTQRPKLEDYPGSEDSPGRLFLIIRTIQQMGRRLISKQTCCFLGRNTLVTFQDSPDDVFGPVRQRIENVKSRLRANDASFLLYSLLHATVDAFFPLLEKCAERIENLEKRVLARPTQAVLQQIHRLRRDIVTVRRVAWPMRELILELRREPHECFSENTRIYLREVHDHILVIFEMVETYRDLLSTLTETYMSTIANRTNAIMKTLTIISTIFVPLTFLVGVYGMNMPIPENNFSFTYPIFWIVVLVVIGGMLWWFRSRHWF
jgi:magnesium transporter